MAQTRRRPMPWYPGPKLGPFQFPSESQGPRITFVEKLGHGLHSEVCRVEISGKSYALKIFRFQHWSELVYHDYLERMSIRDVMGQWDPFNCECRAYGRLQEEGREDLAIPCYGYVILTAEEEDQVNSKWHLDWNRRPQNRGQGLRGLLKEYVPSQQQFDVAQLPQMRKDLLELHQMGIVVFDLREDNYLNGKLIDFSQAHVAPHEQLDMVNNPVLTRQACWKDYIAFDGILEHFGLGRRHPCAFFPAPASSRKLRSAKADRASRSSYGMDEKFLIAAKYDWKKAKTARKAPKSTQPATFADGRISKVTKSPKKNPSRKRGGK